MQQVRLTHLFVELSCHRQLLSLQTACSSSYIVVVAAYCACTCFVVPTFGVHLFVGSPRMHAVSQLAPHTGEYKAWVAAVCEAELGSNRRGAPLCTSLWGATEIDAPVRRAVLSWPGAARIVATSATQTLVETLLFFYFLGYSVLHCETERAVMSIELTSGST